MQTTLFPSSDTKIVLKRQGNVKAKPRPEEREEQAVALAKREKCDILVSMKTSFLLL